MLKHSFITKLNKSNGLKKGKIMPGPFSIMTKPVCGVCNLDCTYCYYKDKVNLYPGEKQFLMDPNVLEEFIKQYLRLQPRSAIITWQGGEPLLAGIDFFKKAREFQHRWSLPGQYVSSTLQTNGVLINDEWADFFARNNFLIGISIDGPKEVHDYFRITKGGKPSFEKAWQGLETLRKHRAEFNVLVTLNSENIKLGGDLYRFFVKRGINWLQFIPILEKDEKGEPLPFSCPPDGYAKFLCETFDTWVVNDVGKISVRIFESIVYTLVKMVPTVCCFAKKCANAYVLEYNGDLYACDHFVFPEWKIGNIMETPLRELLNSPLIEEFSKLKTELPEPCKECEFLPICNGGCPKHHVYKDGVGKVNYFCSAYKEFFKYSIRTFKKIAHDIAQKEGINLPDIGI